MIEGRVFYFVIMKFASFCRMSWVLCTLAVAAHGVAADSPPLLSPIFGDHMVLQRGKPNTFWGWARPGEKIHVAVGEK